MKVLLTGCTAQQVSVSAHGRIPTFAGLVCKALESQGVDVLWTEPHMEMDQDFISMFDQVIVGLVSPASLAANYLYPALSVASHALASGSLTIMADSPEPNKLWTGMVSTAQNPGSLLKDFHARRRDYRAASEPETAERLQRLIEHLVASQWPSVIAPRLPWSANDFLTGSIPNTGATLGLSFDRGIEQPLLTPITDRQISTDSKWYADNVDSKWVAGMAATLSHQVLPLRQKRTETLNDLALRIREGIGTLVATYRGSEPWWTPVIALSLHQKTPVVSDWRHTSILGFEWSQLAVVIEEMDEDARRELAIGQVQAYLDSIPDFADESFRLMKFMDLKSSKKQRK